MRRGNDRDHRDSRGRAEYAGAIGGAGGVGMGCVTSRGSAGERGDPAHGVVDRAGGGDRAADVAAKGGEGNAGGGAQREWSGFAESRSPDSASICWSAERCGGDRFESRRVVVALVGANGVGIGLRLERVSDGAQFRASSRVETSRASLGSGAAGIAARNAGADFRRDLVAGCGGICTSGGDRAGATAQRIERRRNELRADARDGASGTLRRLGESGGAGSEGGGWPASTLLVDSAADRRGARDRVR